MQNKDKPRGNNDRPPVIPRDVTTMEELRRRMRQAADAYDPNGQTIRPNRRRRGQ